MADVTSAFTGKIPEHYDRYLAALLFEPYAEDLVGRLSMHDGTRILEVACGTGIVTRRLVDKLAGRGTIIATDVNEAMFAHARKGLPRRGDATWRHADATSLPFETRSFDAVVCQFGMMFFSDKAAGAREALRVLRPGGLYIFNVWDSLDVNPVQRITHETVAGFFPTNPPTFYTVPCSYHDVPTIEGLLHDAGFDSIRVERVAKDGRSGSAADAAIGLIQGNPIFAEIMQRRPEALPEIQAAVATRLARELGDQPLRAPLRALVATARRPQEQTAAGFLTGRAPGPILRAHRPSLAPFQRTRLEREEALHAAVST